MGLQRAFRRLRLALCRRRRRARSRPARALEGIWTLLHYLIAEQGTVEFDNLRLCIVRRSALSAGNKTKAIVGTLREFWRIVRSPECG